MKILQFLLPICFFLFTSTISAQLKLNVKEMPSGNEYGVFLRPCNGITPSSNTITGTGQVTLKIANGNQLTSTGFHGGTWVPNSTIVGPMEAPNFSYFSFGFVADVPQIILSSGEETLLFTVTVSGSGVPTLIDNDSDPFNSQPNSINSNPGNDISIVDVGVVPLGQYVYSGNYLDDDPDSCSDEPEATPTFEEEGNGHSFDLSPNPASQWLSVDLLYFEQTAALKIWTTTGQLLEQQPVGNQSNFLFQVADLPNGLYIMSLEVEGKVVQREKFLKQ